MCRTHKYPPKATARMRWPKAGTRVGTMGSCPLLTPPAGGWILDSRINKAILKFAVIVVGINLKPRFKTH